MKEGKQKVQPNETRPGTWYMSYQATPCRSMDGTHYRPGFWEYPEFVFREGTKT
jgi:hypothetical protein